MRGLFLKRRARPQRPLAGDFAPGPRDVMLVSYPKSGNTWLRALFTQCTFPGASLSEMEKLVPDIYVTSAKDLKSAHVFPFGGRIIKSHEGYRPTYRKALYIFRDPRDVMISYYFYLKKRNLLPNYVNDMVDFQDPFMAGRLDKFGSWYQNVKSWKVRSGPDTFFCAYESLLDDPELQFGKIARFVGLDCNRITIQRAINLCSIDALRQREREEDQQWREVANTTRDINFFRQGKSDQWQDYDPALFSRIVTSWGGFMRELGYIP